MSGTPPPLQRPAYRPFRATVTAVAPLSPHFVRVSFTGPDFDVFAEHAHDQRIKIVFPKNQECYADLGVDDEESIQRGDWYARWRSLPDDRRSPFRTYTVRTINAAERRLDVDFVAHHVSGADNGPGSQWLGQATPGDDVIIIGPDARSPNSHQGIDWRPGLATDVLLLGDETAAPAIAGILERLPPQRRATAFIEVPSTDDILTLTSNEATTVHWLPRQGTGPVGTLLEGALRQWATGHNELLAAAKAPVRQQLDEVDVDAEILWESPEEMHDAGLYAWIAGESAAVKNLRHILVTQWGIDRHRVAFMGYWRLGQGERIG